MKTALMASYEQGAHSQLAAARRWVHRRQGGAADWRRPALALAGGGSAGATRADIDEPQVQVASPATARVKAAGEVERGPLGT